MKVGTVKVDREGKIYVFTPEGDSSMTLEELRLNQEIIPPMHAIYQSCCNRDRYLKELEESDELPIW